MVSANTLWWTRRLIHLTQLIFSNYRQVDDRRFVSGKQINYAVANEKNDVAIGSRNFHAD